MSLNEDLLPCELCNGRGFVFVHVVEHRRGHWRRKGQSGFAIVAKKVKLKWPCDCLYGDRWLERKKP